MKFPKYVWAVASPEFGVVRFTKTRLGARRYACSGDAVIRCAVEPMDMVKKPKSKKPKKGY